MPFTEGQTVIVRYLLSENREAVVLKPPDQSGWVEVMEYVPEHDDYYSYQAAVEFVEAKR